MNISDSVFYVGVNDHNIDLFEGQFEVPNGMAYNSYMIVSDKIAVMDSVDAAFGKEWIDNIENVLKNTGKSSPDYLVVQHMEMDHSANVMLFSQKYPQAKIVASKMAFNIMKNLFGTVFPEKQIVVSDGLVLDLGGGDKGKRLLHFISAPNVHWPEVIMTYDEKEKILFSADAFGKFGALDYNDPEGWACEARRYYFGIVGKFGAAVQDLLAKASKFDIQKICSLHGPVLDENIPEYINKYNIWSSYGIESKGTAIFYTSVYGHTKALAEKLAEILIEKGCPKVVVNDLAREDIYECVEDAFRYGKIVLATTTYNGGVFPKMKEFIDHLNERNYQGRKIGLIENGSWVPSAAKGMYAMLEGGKDITFCQTKVSVKIQPTEANIQELRNMADELL
ncbi:MAG: flavodoxin domain-containing protein [Treponema sp.]|nr:flavodoxin domain-containing protein [Treponema sp.]